MTEPVAYIYNYANGDYALWHKTEQHIEKAIPLYTKEQLHPRVKMTKKQYNRLMWDKENTDLFQCLDYFHEHDGNSKFGALTEDLRGDLAPEDIARAWLDEETIEIVPTMKWFVRAKKPEGEDEDEDYLFLSGSDLDDLEYFGFDYARAFDTKEEAELWTNPLTEAVQLSVELNND